MRGVSVVRPADPLQARNSPRGGGGDPARRCRWRFPTDTLYGLAADPRSAECRRPCWHLKGSGRRAEPSRFVAADLAQVDRICCPHDDGAARGGARFWPGPLTVLMRAKPGPRPNDDGPDGPSASVFGSRRRPCADTRLWSRGHSDQRESKRAAGDGRPTRWPRRCPISISSSTPAKRPAVHPPRSSISVVTRRASCALARYRGIAC